MKVPKYWRVRSDHLNLNCVCKALRVVWATLTPIAADLTKLIFRLESMPYILNLRRFGRDTTGLVREKRKSSA